MLQTLKNWFAGYKEFLVDVGYIAILLVCLFIAWLLMFTTMADAQEDNEVRFIQPELVKITPYKHDYIYDPYIYPDDAELKYGAEFTTNLYLVKWRDLGLRWENDLFFDQSERDGKIKHAGWHYLVSARVWTSDTGQALEFGQEHVSRHVFDEARPGQHFPAWTRRQVTFVLYENRN